MAKYYRKQPVEAIQWNGDNQIELSEFIGKVVKDYYTKDDGYGNLNVCYMDSKKHKHLSAIPKYGWVVIEGKTLQFYKGKTFKKTFKAAEEDNNGIDWAGMTNTINRAFDSFDDMFKGFHGVPKEKIQDAVDEQAKMRKDPFYVLANEDVCKDNDKNWKDAIKRAGVKICDDVLTIKLANGKDNESDTFDTVLDEMKELHAKKNKDYKGSFHDLFEEYGMPYALGHLEEKLNRVKAITKNGGNAVKNDHIEDSVIDLACYAVMLYMEIKRIGHED